MGGHNDTAYEVPDDSDEKQTELAVCLVSGGMDSCVTAAMAQRDVSRLAFLHISYGQRTEARELQAFEDLAAHYGSKSASLFRWPISLKLAAHH